MPLKALTIDLWNTLIRDTDEQDRAALRMDALQAALADMGHAVTRAQVASAHARCGKLHAQLQATGRDCSATAHVQLFLDALGPDFAQAAAFTSVQREQLTEIYGDAALLVRPVALAGALEMLAELRAMGLRLALISNTGRTPGRVLRRIMADLRLDAPFDTLIFSDEGELAKPNPAIFAIALAALGVTTSEALHLGDDLVLDWQGAHAAGLPAGILRAEGPPDLVAPDFWVTRLAEVATQVREMSASGA